jgi:hypothetical protein
MLFFHPTTSSSLLLIVTISTVVLLQALVLVFSMILGEKKVGRHLEHGIDSVDEHPPVDFSIETCLKTH